MSDKFKEHAIQIKALKVITLSIEANTNNAQDMDPDNGLFKLFHGHSAFMPELREIAVNIGAEIDSEENSAPFSLKVELLGIFHIDISRFKEEHIIPWAKTNAPLILYPYLREHVYSLTSRAGFKGVLLPLFEIPSFNIKAPDNKPLIKK